jgi:hypothetical protein
MKSRDGASVNGDQWTKWDRPVKPFLATGRFCDHPQCLSGLTRVQPLPL